MKRAKASDFPELRRFFAGYLHEDFVVEHGTPAAALRAFVADANASERQRLRDEAKRFLALMKDMEFDDAVARVDKLGSRWVPESRAELVRLFERMGKS